MAYTCGENEKAKLKNLEPNLSKIIINECSHNEWEMYVKKHPCGTIYHLPQWKEVFEKSFPYRPFYLFARDETEKLCGIFPLFLIKSWLTGNRLVSLPFSYISGPVVNSSFILEAFLEKTKKLCQELKCDYIETRVANNVEESKYSNLWHDKGFKECSQFYTYLLSLSQGEVWRKLDSSIRRGVKKAIKDGVTIRKGNFDGDLRCFYNLNLKNKGQLGVPGHPYYFLSNICERMNDFIKLYLAEFEGKVIAGIITMEFKDTVIYGYGASDVKYLVHRPNNLLIWTAIEDAINNRFSFFDFGRVSLDDEGLSKFKKRWGTQEIKLSYYYWPFIPNSILLNYSFKYRLATGLWKKIPLNINKWCSDIVFKHLN